jgi:TRAP-type C4-dicarboxylate transport system permease small subunit
MQRVVQVLDVILKNVLIVLMAALVAAVSWQVISRYVFSSPSSWTEEVARFLMIWIGLLGASYAFRTRVHLGLDLLPKKLTGRSAEMLKLFTLAVIVLFSITVLIVGGGKLVSLTWELRQYSAVLGLPIAFVYSVIPTAGILICLYAIVAVKEDSIAESDSTADAGPADTGV